MITLKKINEKVEYTLAFGGRNLLEKPVLVNAVVAIAMATDFSVFYNTFSGINDFFSSLLVAACCAAIIDTVPLVTARCINNLCRAATQSKSKNKWDLLVLTASGVAFLTFFALTAMVRWQSGSALFDLGVSTNGQDTQLASADLSPAQSMLLLFTCLLPLFTSVGVLLVGLFVDDKAARRKMLRSQRNELSARRSELIAQKLDLENVLKLDLDATDELLYHDMKDYIDTLCLVLGSYFRKALAERLKTPEDLSYLSRRSRALAAAEARIFQLAKTEPQDPAVGGETNHL